MERNPLPDGDIGECHRPETHLIPITIEAALGQRRSIRVNGTDYPTPDGTAAKSRSMSSGRRLRTVFSSSGVASKRTPQLMS